MKANEKLPAILEAFKKIKGQRVTINGYNYVVYQVRTGKNAFIGFVKTQGKSLHLVYTDEIGYRFGIRKGVLGYFQTNTSTKKSPIFIPFKTATSLAGLGRKKQPLLEEGEILEFDSIAEAMAFIKKAKATNYEYSINQSLYFGNGNELFVGLDDALKAGISTVKKEASGWVQVASTADLKKLLHYYQSKESYFGFLFAEY